MLFPYKIPFISRFILQICFPSHEQCILRNIRLNATNSTINQYVLSVLQRIDHPCLQRYTEDRTVFYLSSFCSVFVNTLAAIISSSHCTSYIARLVPVRLRLQLSSESLGVTATDLKLSAFRMDLKSEQHCVHVKWAKSRSILDS